MRRSGNRYLVAAAAAFGAGALAYANPAADLLRRAAQDSAAAERSFHAFRAACAFDWDHAPVARAVVSILQ